MACMARIAHPRQRSKHSDGVTQNVDGWLGALIVPVAGLPRHAGWAATADAVVPYRGVVLPASPRGGQVTAIGWSQHFPNTFSGDSIVQPWPDTPLRGTRVATMAEKYAILEPGVLQEGRKMHLATGIFTITALSPDGRSVLICNEGDDIATTAPPSRCPGAWRAC